MQPHNSAATVKPAQIQTGQHRHRDASIATDTRNTRDLGEELAFLVYLLFLSACSPSLQLARLLCRCPQAWALAFNLAMVAKKQILVALLVIQQVHEIFVFPPFSAVDLIAASKR